MQRVDDKKSNPVDMLGLKFDQCRFRNDYLILVDSNHIGVPKSNENYFEKFGNWGHHGKKYIITCRIFGFEGEDLIAMACPNPESIEKLKTQYNHFKLHFYVTPISFLQLNEVDINDIKPIYPNLVLLDSNELKKVKEQLQITNKHTPAAGPGPVLANTSAEAGAGASADNTLTPPAKDETNRQFRI